MRRTVAALAGCLALAAPALADDPGVIPVRIFVGDTVPLEPAPVRTLVCDDTRLVAPVDTPRGTALRAKAVGTTLCSFTDAFSMRRVWRITVEAVPPAGTPPDPSTAPPGGGR